MRSQSVGINCFQLQLTESMVFHNPILIEAYMAKNNSTRDFYKGAYWKSLTPDHMTVKETLVPYHLVVPNIPRDFLDMKERKI